MMKHKCGKRIVTLSLLYFSLIFLGLPFYGLSLSLSLFLFLTWDNAIENDDHHTSIYLQLMDYNSILEQDMTLYECLQRCTRICNESRVTCMKNYAWWLCHKYDVNYMIMQKQYDNDECVMIKGMVESCMAIYLGMAMEMP